MTTKKTRIKHSPEFKAEALKLADKVGVAATARASRRGCQAQKAATHFAKNLNLIATNLC